jgi:hypothetical protein
MRIDGVLRAWEKTDYQEIEKGPQKKEGRQVSACQPSSRHLSKDVVFGIFNV